MRYRRILALAIIILLIIPAWALAQTNVRAWYAKGQTWIVWEESTPVPVTYEIHISDSEFTSIGQAQLAGRIFKQEWSGLRLGYADWSLTFTIPDGNKGEYTLKDNEGVFVYTPQTEGTGYFAVVKTGDTAVTADNLAGPVTLGADPAQCHLQYTGTSHWGGEYNLWAFWIRGGADWDDGDEDFPAMGNAQANGTPVLFAVVEPAEGRRESGKVPAVIGLHGTGAVSSWYDLVSNYIAVVDFDLTLADALLVSPDDSIFIRKEGALGDVTDHASSRWFGYWEDYDRFTAPQDNPPDGSVIVDFTVRKVRFIHKWLLDNQNVDETKVSLLGYSGGSSGAGYLARLYADEYSAVLNYIPIYTSWTLDSLDAMWGTTDQNLPSNYPGGPGMKDLQWPAFELNGRRPLFTRYLMGKNDGSEPWADRVKAMDEIEARKWGVHFFWDEREHITGFENAYWNKSPRLQAHSLVRFSSNQSYPAVTNCDQNPALSGRQPDPGQTQDNGDPWGTWGGFVDWDTDSVTDETDTWSATLYLVSGSDFENDNAPFETAVADVTIQRAQNFLPAAGMTVYWAQANENTKMLIDSGSVKVDSDALVTVKKIAITKEPSVLTVTTEAPGIGDDDDDDTDGSDDDDSSTETSDTDNGKDDGGGCGC